jgi:hypothetical protein
LEEQENELLTEKAYKANLLSANTALSNELQDAHEKLLSALGDDMDAYIEESIILREDEGKFVFCFPYIEGKKMEWETMEKLLNDFSRQESWFTNCCYNPRSWEYTREMYHASVNTRKDFPALHAAIFGTDNTDPDFVFSKGPDDHYLYYFNPCSNAGGQIVICPFDDEMAKRVIAGEDFIEVAAEAPQYLADINHISFFDTISELIELLKEGNFIGKSTSKEDMISLMKKIVGKKNGEQGLCENQAPTVRGTKPVDSSASTSNKVFVERGQRPGEEIVDTNTVIRGDKPQVTDQISSDICVTRGMFPV